MRTLLCLLFVTGTLANAAMLDKLDASQKQQLQGGQSVMVTTNVQGGIWPKITIYRVVDANPQQLYQLFTDYNSAPSYTPGMIEAKVVATPNANTKDVQYTVKMPVLSKITYTVRNVFSQKGDSYEVKWTLLESPLASESTGSFHVEPYAGGKALLRYINYVVPKTKLAGVLKNQAGNEAQTTVQAIAQEAAKRAGNN